MSARKLIAKLSSVMPSKRDDEKAVSDIQDEVGSFFKEALRAHDNWYYSHSEAEQLRLPSFVGSSNVIEKAARAGDVDSLLAYARFPELSDLMLEHLLPLLRKIHGTASVYSIVRQEHIDYYRRVSNVCFVHDTHKGIPEWESDRKYLERFVFENMEQAEEILRIADEREITSVDTIKELMTASAVAPAIGEGVL